MIRILAYAGITTLVENVDKECDQHQVHRVLQPKLVNNTTYYLDPSVKEVRKRLQEAAKCDGPLRDLATTWTTAQLDFLASKVDLLQVCAGAFLFFSRLYAIKYVEQEHVILQPEMQQVHVGRLKP